MASLQHSLKGQRSEDTPTPNGQPAKHCSRRLCPTQGSNACINKQTARPQVKLVLNGFV